MYDKYIKLYDDPEMYDQWDIGPDHHRSKFLLEFALGPDVLELGCGGSGFLRLLSDREDWRLTGVDVNTKWIALGRERLPKVRYFHSLIEDWDNRDLFDTVILMEVLEHVIDPTVVINIALDHTIPGGRILLTVPKKGSQYDYTDNHVRQFTVGSLTETLSFLEHISPRPMAFIWEDDDYTIYGVIQT